MELTLGLVAIASQPHIDWPSNCICDLCRILHEVCMATTNQCD